MAYIKTSWVARVGTALNRFLKTNETSTEVELTNDPTGVTTAGTPFTVANMNKIEDGIYDAHEAISDLDKTISDDIATLTSEVNKKAYLAHTQIPALIPDGMGLLAPWFSLPIVGAVFRKSVLLTHSRCVIAWGNPNSSYYTTISLYEIVEGVVTQIGSNYLLGSYNATKVNIVAINETDFFITTSQDNVIHLMRTSASGISEVKTFTSGSDVLNYGLAICWVNREKTYLAVINRSERTLQAYKFNQTLETLTAIGNAYVYNSFSYAETDINLISQYQVLITNSRNTAGTHSYMFFALTTNSSGVTSWTFNNVNVFTSTSLLREYIMINQTMAISTDILVDIPSFDLLYRFTATNIGVVSVLDDHSGIILAMDSGSGKLSFQQVDFSGI